VERRLVLPDAPMFFRYQITVLQPVTTRMPRPAGDAMWFPNRLSTRGALAPAPAAQRLAGDPELPRSQDRLLAQAALHACPRRLRPLHRSRPARPHALVLQPAPTPVRLPLQGRDPVGSATASSDPEAVAAGLRRYPKAAKAARDSARANGTVTASRPPVVVTVLLDRR